METNGKNINLFFQISKKIINIILFYRNSKDLKNHFHTCIIKTVRRIINCKFDTTLKDIMRCFYSFNYLKNMIDNKNRKPLTIISTEKKNKKKYKFNPKILIKNNKLTKIKIDKYSKDITEKVLLSKPGIIQFLNLINYYKNFNYKLVPWLFNIIIKSFLTNKCKQILDDNLLKNKNELDKIKKFIEDNEIFIKFNNFFEED